MGTARHFNKILHDEIDVYAAWLPVTNNFQLGDYGVISDGVFAKLGNIDEFEVKFNEEDGAQSHLKFRSAGPRSAISSLELLHRRYRRLTSMPS